MMRYNFVAVLILIGVVNSGCIPVATTAAGVGGSAALSHTINGTTNRTFTAPASKVRVAAINALGRMKIKVISEVMQDKNKVILVKAKTTERNIEIHIEPISTNTTRMTVAAKSSLFSYDNATSEEIIMQTKKSLG